MTYFTTVYAWSLDKDFRRPPAQNPLSPPTPGRTHRLFPTNLLLPAFPGIPDVFCGLATLYPDLWCIYFSTPEPRPPLCYHVQHMHH